MYACMYVHMYAHYVHMYAHYVRTYVCSHSNSCIHYTYVASHLVLQNEYIHIDNIVIVL